LVTLGVSAAKRRGAEGEGEGKGEEFMGSVFVVFR